MHYVGLIFLISFHPFFYLIVKVYSEKV